MHLDWWYAQSHPAEDFAETFAVWLKPRSKWRKDYEDWSVIKKLEYMEELMAGIQHKTPINRNRSFVDPISKINKSLRDHYQQKRSHYGVNLPHVYDSELIRLFKKNSDDDKRHEYAAIF
jgi:hypothetical protein